MLKDVVCIRISKKQDSAMIVASECEMGRGKAAGKSSKLDDVSWYLLPGLTAIIRPLKRPGTTSTRESVGLVCRLGARRALLPPTTFCAPRQLLLLPRLDLLSLSLHHHGSSGFSSRFSTGSDHSA